MTQSLPRKEQANDKVEDTRRKWQVSEYIFSSNRVTLYRSDFMSERFVNSSITMITTSNLFVVHKTDQLVIRA